ncbi:MAG: hypothetical protein KGS48_10340 [Bacteroidetes bacterium]|nr:hypothetical protein [Bacteroidota bacterium]
MQKVVLFFAFFLTIGIASVQAQACAGHAEAGKSCCASKISKAAAADPTIESRKSDDGSLAYVRKETDAQGNVKFVSVQFDEASNTFVNVAPKTVNASDKAGMTKKACCASGDKKACAGEKGGKACCASKAGSASSAEQ